MTKFTIALREIGTYKEVLRSQVLKTIAYVFLELISFKFIWLMFSLYLYVDIMIFKWCIAKLWCLVNTCQVEHMLSDRLLQFVNGDVHEVKVFLVPIPSIIAKSLW